MWIASFVIGIGVALCLGVAASMMRDRDAAKARPGRLSYGSASLGTNLPATDLNALLASPEVLSVMRADLIDGSEVLQELNAVSLQLQKNAGPVFTCDRAVLRLRNMSEMMDRLGYDAEMLARTDLNVGSIFRACQTCSAEEVCGDWLARAPKSLKRAPAFCPNAERFAQSC